MLENYEVTVYFVTQFLLRKLPNEEMKELLGSYLPIRLSLGSRSPFFLGCQVTPKSLMLN